MPSLSQQLSRPALLGGQLQRPDPMPTLLPQSSIQIAFEEVPQLPPRASISRVTCVDQSERTMVRVCGHCLLLGPEGG